MTDESTIYLFSLALLFMFFQSNQANPRHRQSNSSATTSNPLITSETGTKAKAMSFFYIQMEQLILQIFFFATPNFEFDAKYIDRNETSSLKRIDQVIIIQ